MKYLSDGVKILYGFSFFLNWCSANNQKELTAHTIQQNTLLKKDAANIVA